MGSLLFISASLSYLYSLISIPGVIFSQFHFPSFICGTEVARALLVNRSSDRSCTRDMIHNSAANRNISVIGLHREPVTHAAISLVHYTLDWASSLKSLKNMYTGCVSQFSFLILNRSCGLFAFTGCITEVACSVLTKETGPFTWFYAVMFMFNYWLDSCLESVCLDVFIYGFVLPVIWKLTNMITNKNRLNTYSWHHNITKSLGASKPQW